MFNYQDSSLEAKSPGAQEFPPGPIKKVSVCLSNVFDVNTPVLNTFTKSKVFLASG